MLSHWASFFFGFIHLLLRVLVYSCIYVIFDFEIEFWMARL